MEGNDVIETTTLTRVTEVLAGVLDGHGPGDFTPDTLLFGSLPELDSLALVELITSLENRFGFEMDEDDITAEVFESVGTLAAFVDTQR